MATGLRLAAVITSAALIKSARAASTGATERKLKPQAVLEWSRRVDDKDDDVCALLRLSVALKPARAIYRKPKGELQLG